MWTRLELKTRTKAIMKLGYWKMFLVGLLLALVSSNNKGNFNYDNTDKINFDGSGLSFNGDVAGGVEAVKEIPAFAPWLFMGALGLGILVVLIALGLRIFLGMPLEVGCKRFYLKATGEEFDMNHVGFSFNSAWYMNIVKTMFYRGLLILLWTLLLIIPGIIKSYAYRMVPYILSDNPNIDFRRAVELSDDMTSGQKFDIFVLDLSFIGWYILGGLALGIGVFFVNPYVYGTNAELYNVLKESALRENLCSADELTMNEEQFEF